MGNRKTTESWAARPRRPERDAMHKFAIVCALLFAVALIPAGCGKDKKQDHGAATAVDIDDSAEAASFTPRPRPWEQYYNGEAEVDMPSAPAPAADSAEEDELAALFGDDGGGESVDVAVGGKATLPFKLYLSSEDVNTGKVTGEIEWTSLGASNEVQGEVGRGFIRFEETAVIINGREPGCKFDLAPSASGPPGALSGTVDCSAGPGGSGTITMTMEAAEVSGDDFELNFDDEEDEDLDLDSLDEESETEDSGSDFDESDFDALFGEESEKPAPKAKPAQKEDDVDAALDALFGGESEKPAAKPKPEPKKPEKKPEAKPKAKSGSPEEEPMDLLMEMIDDTDVD